MSISTTRVQGLFLREKGQFSTCHLIWIESDDLISVRDRYLALLAKTDLATTHDVYVQPITREAAREWRLEFGMGGGSAPRVPHTYGVAA